MPTPDSDSEPLIREQVIEEAARAVADTANVPFVGAVQRRYATAALPVITRAITDRVRALHGPSPHSLVRCACGVVEPCPTVRELDAIDADFGVQR